MKLRYYTNCMNWPRADVHAPGGLCDMIAEETGVTRRTFLHHVNRDDLKAIEEALGYDRGFRMSGDWHVSYHRSKLHGVTVYYFKHSAIEYVFKPSK